MVGMFCASTMGVASGFGPCYAVLALHLNNASPGTRAVQGTLLAVLRALIKVLFTDHTAAWRDDCLGRSNAIS